MTEEQRAQLSMYLSKLRDGEDYTLVDGKRNYFTQCGHHRDAFASLLAAINGQPPPEIENVESALRNQLRIWSMNP
jgi:hypothetical protein